MLAALLLAGPVAAWAEAPADEPDTTTQPDEPPIRQGIEPERIAPEPGRAGEVPTPGRSHHLGWVACLMFPVAGAVLTALLILLLTHRKQSQDHPRAALDGLDPSVKSKLDMRLAAGEIDVQQYRLLLAELTGRAPEQTPTPQDDQPR
jgi:hypothetical protein